MTDEQKAAIIYFKTGVITPNELRKKFSLASLDKSEADMLLVPLGDRNGYVYVSLNGEMHVNIAEFFPTQILKAITGS